MGRRRLALALVVLAVLGGGFVWALPEILRRVALDQIPERTGRIAAIEDVDLNLFTGRLAVKKVRLDEPDGSSIFLAADRLEARLSPTALLRGDIRLTEASIVAPFVQVVRTGPAEFNFSDLTSASAASPEGETEAPGRWTFTVDRFTLSGGTVRIQDRTVAPAADWLVQDLSVDLAGITTRPGAAPGRLDVHARIDEAVLDVKAERLRLTPPVLGATVALSGFETRRLAPYAFAGTPYAPRGGRLAVALQAQVDSDTDEALTQATLSGTVTLEGQSLSAAGRPEPFLDVARLTVDLKEADAISRSLTVARVAVEGLDLEARRDAKGAIDLVAMLASRDERATTGPGAAAPVPAAATPEERRRLVPVLRGLSRGFEQIRVERITLGPSTATLVDESVTPTARLALTKLQATVEDVTWPVQGPSSLALSTALPGGGTLRVQGPVVVQPLDADLVFRLRDAPVQPYQPYIPVPARLAGRFNGDSRNRIALKDGRMVLASRGTSWAQNVEIRAPGSDRPVMRVERMELVGIDFDWPRRASVKRAAFRRPTVEIERGADGSINVQRLFAAPDAPEPGQPSGPAPAAGQEPPAEAPKGLLQTMRLEFGEVKVEQGFIRFLDRTTSPAFSHDLSRLDLTVTGLSNRPGQRAQLALSSVVGGDAALDLNGELGSLGSPAFADLVGELRSFKLASVDPYTDSTIGWVVKKGDLQYRLHFKLADNVLDVTNEVVVGQLQVAPSGGEDEVKQRLGLPLNLIVALLKDGRGEIRANVPVTGDLDHPDVSLRETIWTAIKNVVVNIVKAPFKAIGRLFADAEKLEEPKVDPVTFAAGSAVLAPAMEEHLLRVADFLRRTPFVNLTMTPALGPGDREALEAEALTARLAEFQKARGLPDLPAALAAYFKERFPDLERPAGLAEQLALLREREPAPEGLLADLARRRLDATRDRLVTAEGIPAHRLIEPEALLDVARAAEGSGRVEFTVVAGGE